MNQDTLVIPLEELNARRDSVLSAMEEAGVELAVFTSAPGIYYLAGFEFGGFATRHALLLRADGASWFVVREVEHAWKDAVSDHTWLGEWILYPDAGDWIDTLAAAVNGAVNGPSRLAAELTRTSLTHYEAITLSKCPNVVDLVDAAPIVEGIRAVKTPLEVELVRQAGQATAAGTLAAHSALSRGSDDYEATLEAMRAMRLAGSGMVTDGPFVVTGSGSALAHARASGRRALPGDLASTMMTASVGRYQCPLERTFPIDHADSRTGELIQLTAAATRHVIAHVGPGMTSHDADLVARTYYRQRGMAAGFSHRLGYSVGVAYPPLWWENDVMQMRPHDARVLKTGMVFHLVPGIHVETLGFINQSMTVHITDTGCEALVELPLVLDPA